VFTCSDYLDERWFHKFIGMVRGHGGSV